MIIRWQVETVFSFFFSLRTLLNPYLLIPESQVRNLLSFMHLSKRVRERVIMEHPTVHYQNPITAHDIKGGLILTYQFPASRLLIKAIHMLMSKLEGIIISLALGLSYVADKTPVYEVRVIFL
jgi:hypothetical protein